MRVIRITNDRNKYQHKPKKSKLNAVQNVQILIMDVTILVFENLQWKRWHLHHSWIGLYKKVYNDNVTNRILDHSALFERTSKISLNFLKFLSSASN